MKKIWYAVQETEDDGWDWGSYDYAEAVKMLKDQGHGLIAVIEEDELHPICVKEIEYKDIVEEEPVDGEWEVYPQ
jgi:hypothetical protein